MRHAETVSGLRGHVAFLANVKHIPSPQLAGQGRLYRVTWQVELPCQSESSSLAAPSPARTAPLAAQSATHSSLAALQQPCPGKVSRRYPRKAQGKAGGEDGPSLGSARHRFSLGTSAALCTRTDAVNRPAYVDTNLVGTGKISRAAILGQQGGVWASSAGYTLSTEEQANLCKIHNDPAAAQANGIHAAGQKFLCIRADDRSVYGKKQARISLPPLEEIAGALTVDDRYPNAGGRHHRRQDQAGHPRRRIRSPDPAGRGHQDHRGESLARGPDDKEASQV